MATFQLSSAASLNLEWSQNGVLGNGLRKTDRQFIITILCIKALSQQSNYNLY